MHILCIIFKIEKIKKPIFNEIQKPKTTDKKMTMMMMPMTMMMIMTMMPMTMMMMIGDDDVR